MCSFICYLLIFFLGGGGRGVEVYAGEDLGFWAVLGARVSGLRSTFQVVSEGM